MKKEKLGQESAFLTIENNVFEHHNGSESREQYTRGGMSKRFYAACAAMQGLLAYQNLDMMKFSFEEVIPKLAFMYADELLKQENV